MPRPALDTTVFSRRNFKDTPSQLSMKTLCIEARFWGSNMKKCVLHPKKTLNS